MSKHLSNAIDALATMDLGQLRKRYLELFGHPTAAKDRDILITKIGERIAFGPRGKTAPTPGVATAPAATEKGKGKARKAPETTDTASPFTADPRLPAPGSTIKVTHKGKEYAAKFLGADGFEVEGKRYRSLSAAASEILGGVAVNGFLWWGLIPRSAPAAKAEKPATLKAKAARRGGKAKRAKPAKKA